MDLFLANFHFLRPLWLLALIPAILLFGALRHARAHSSHWAKTIDSSLLPHLLDGDHGKRLRWPLTVLLLAWLLSSLSMAGPESSTMP